ncbi:MAG TPA: hypothetical protein DCL76_07140 [Chloroflexi bacterium]|nr:hypothetical protein [Chloroflexota bacterium]HCU98301.1 hypothetical protein [Chloroflexota bacterium]
MNQNYNNLNDLIKLAESGEIKAALEGLRIFTKKNPNKLEAWKWLADLSNNNKERSAAIRRAQLLAPGDKWVIQSKKQSKLPVFKPNIDKSLQKHNTDTKKQPITNETPNNDWDNNSNTTIDKPNKISTHKPTNLRFASLQNPKKQKSKSTQGTTNKNQQFAWLIWIAILMSVSGIILISIAWYMR